MDPLDEWSNWDQLLAWAEIHGVVIDEQVEEIAQRTLRAAERAVAAAGDDEDDASMFEAIEVSLADAIDIASIGAANLQDYEILSDEDIKPVISCRLYVVIVVVVSVKLNINIITTLCESKLCSVWR